jgi:hypothetical protein
VVTIFEYPDYETSVGTAKSWSAAGEVRDPDQELDKFLRNLGAGKELCVKVDDGKGAVTWMRLSGARFGSAQGMTTYIGADSVISGDESDCCSYEPTAAKKEGAI